VPVVCRSQAVRDTLVSACSNRIEIRPIVGGDMTQQPFFKHHVPARYQLPTSSMANLIHHQGLYFGNYPEMTKQDLATIATIFRQHVQAKK
jgi:CDP-6-deoxy-D-xylo-4-hexulose-3-dehydrase